MQYCKKMGGDGEEQCSITSGEGNDERRGAGEVKSIEENAARNGVRWGVGVKKEALCLLLREDGG